MRKRSRSKPGKGYWQQYEWRRRLWYWRLRQPARLMASGLFIGALIGIALFSADLLSNKKSSEELARLWERYKDFGKTEQKPAPSPQNWSQVRTAPSSEQGPPGPPKGFEEHYRRPAEGGRPAYIGPRTSPDRAQEAAVVRFHICASATRINCVVDGDTIWFRGEKIRIADINTPEISSPKCSSEADLGHQAKRRLLELLNAGPFQVVRSGSRDRDRYGRLLRVIERDGQSLGMILVDEGLAHVWDGRKHPWC
jgi:endonuclease YncB( thermonuclease family)